MALTFWLNLPSNPSQVVLPMLYNDVVDRTCTIDSNDKEVRGCGCILLIITTGRQGQKQTECDLAWQSSAALLPRPIGCW